MRPFSNGWYLLYTMPNNEKKITAQLTEQRILSYSPAVKVLRQWCDRRKLIEKPMFPSYVFIYLRDLHDYYSGLAINGVITYVKFGNELARVPEATVSNVVISAAKGKGVEISSNRFSKGQAILINKGPLSGLSGEVVEYKGVQKILIRLDLLRSNVLVDLPCEHVIDVCSEDLAKSA